MNDKLIMITEILTLFSLLSFNVSAQDSNTSFCTLFDSTSNRMSNPRQKEINSYLALIDQEAKKGNILPMFSESPEFYAILPETKDTLTIPEYLSHVDKTKIQGVDISFSVSINWDCKIRRVIGYCTTLENDSDNYYWLMFWKNIRVRRPARINSIPAEMTTNLK